jgi:hypothetical protein
MERDMGRFRHPHALRGFVYTSKGAFAVVRGIVEAPDAVGESFGWLRADEHDVPVDPPSDGAARLAGASSMELGSDRALRARLPH